MSRLCILLLAVLVGNVWAEEEDPTQEHWDAYKDKYNKTYDSPDEENKRKDIFIDNLLKVALHNVKDEHDYDKDVHEFSDMTEDEQIAALCQTEMPENFTSTRVLEDFSTSERQLPGSVDWVQAGKVSNVKNQGGCGSCWSFSAASALESQAAIKWNGIWPLSEQQLVDCSRSYGNGGCNGGWPQTAFKYIKDNGLREERCYGYTGKDGDCRVPDCGYNFGISDYKNVGPAGDEYAVAKALAERGPLTCAIYVSNNFMHYSGGIFRDSSYKDQGVNHGVTLVGYGTENGQDYWKIRNSWGESWGEGGYIRVVRNSGSHIHVADYTSYPII